MIRKPKPDPLDAALAAVAALDPPLTQAEWRKVSTALRTVRRLALARNRAVTPQVQCGGSRRYLCADTWGERTRCYNLPAHDRALFGLAMLARARRMHAEGYGQKQGDESRANQARYWADYAREQIACPLPDRRAA